MKIDHRIALFGMTAICLTGMLSLQHVLRAQAPQPAPGAPVVTAENKVRYLGLENKLLDLQTQVDAELSKLNGLQQQGQNTRAELTAALKEEAKSVDPAKWHICSILDRGFGNFPGCTGDNDFQYVAMPGPPKPAPEPTNPPDKK